MEQNLDAQQIVSKAAEIMFAQTDRYTPVLQAIQSAIGITVDGDLLVIGFEPKDNQLAGHLTASINRNLIAQAIQEAAGRQLLPQGLRLGSGGRRPGGSRCLLAWVFHRMSGKAYLWREQGRKAT